MRIVLCPGHYPNRPGAKNKKFDILEHNAAVKVIAHLEEVLLSKGDDVIMITGTLSQKIKKINSEHQKKKIDIALDVHFNADPEEDDTNDNIGYGSEVIYCPGSTLRHKQAAEMSDTIAHFLGSYDRGAKEGWYWGSGVINGKPTKKDAFVSRTACAAFIPEPGFIDNNRFCEMYLLDDTGYYAIASAIANAIKGLK